MFRWLFSRVMAPDDDGVSGGGEGGEGEGKPGAEGGKAGEGGEGEGKKTLLSSAAGDGGEGGEGEGKPGAEGEWAWGENVAGTGTVPPWFKGDKYKTVADQAKAAGELEVKLGSAAEVIGAPEGDYELPKMPEGVEGEWDQDDAMLKEFRTVAKDLGLSQTAFDKVVTSMSALLASEEAAAKTQVSDAVAELGTNAKARIEAVDAYLKTALNEEGYKALDAAVGVDVNAYKALEILVGKASGDAQLSSLPGQQGLGYSKSDIEAEQYKVFPEGHKLAGKPMYEHDKEHRAKVDGMWKELYPGEDRQEVG